MEKACPVVYPAYVGLDVHKDRIGVAVAPAGRGSPEYHGEIASKSKNVAKLEGRLKQAYGGGVPLFSYEAGPCGYALCRQILSLDDDCNASQSATRLGVSAPHAATTPQPVCPLEKACIPA